MRLASRVLIVTFFFAFGGLVVRDVRSASHPQQGATVPEELVRAIVGYDAELIVGELPAELASTLTLPDGAHVVGSVVGEPLVNAYLQVPGDADAVIGFFREQLVGAGWRTPPEQPQRRGFQAPPSALRSAGFCSPENAYLTVSTGYDERGTVRVSYYAAFPRDLPCDRPAQRTGGPGELRDRMPVLILPQEEMQGPGRQGASYGAGRESYLTSVELHTTRGAAAIAAAIAEQVEGEGWVPGRVVEDDSDAVRTWARTFDDDIEMLASLTVVEVVDGVYDVEFKIRLPPDPAQTRSPDR